jgi:uncharacterized spore protein YtfJ
MITSESSQNAKSQECFEQESDIIPEVIEKIKNKRRRTKSSSEEENESVDSEQQILQQVSKTRSGRITKKRNEI